MDAVRDPLVFVTVGTDHHRFDRLLTMAADWAATHPAVEVLVQSGHTPPPAGLDAVAFMNAEEVAGAYRRATAVVCHGGPSTIMEARAVGHVPIVVARDPQLGEHVDGHQLRFADHLGDRGLVVTARTPEALAEHLDRALVEGPAIAGAVERPEARASIERIGALLDDLMAERAPHGGPT